MLDDLYHAPEYAIYVKTKKKCLNMDFRSINRMKYMSIYDDLECNNDFDIYEVDCPFVFIMMACLMLAFFYDKKIE